VALNVATMSRVHQTRLMAAGHCWPSLSPESTRCEPRWNCATPGWLQRLKHGSPRPRLRCSGWQVNSWNDCRTLAAHYQPHQPHWPLGFRPIHDPVNKGESWVAFIYRIMTSAEF